MPRPVKCRRVGFSPRATYFKPSGIPARYLETVSLTIEELEAVRLKDRRGLQQEECAQIMGISRPTFHRVLISARSKIAEALIEGRAIRIEGGDFEMVQHRLKCEADGHEWDVPPDELDDESLPECPRCKSTDVGFISEADRGRFGRGRRGRGRCGQ